MINTFHFRLLWGFYHIWLFLQSFCLLYSKLFNIKLFSNTTWCHRFGIINSYEYFFFIPMGIKDWFPVLWFPVIWKSYYQEFNMAAGTGSQFLILIGVQKHTPNYYHCRANFKIAPSQWETSLQSNTISHWLGANLESSLHWFRICPVACFLSASPNWLMKRLLCTWLES